MNALQQYAQTSEVKSQFRESGADRTPFSAAGQKPSARYVYYVIGLLFVVNVFNYMDRMALAVLLPSIKADLKLSDGQLGLLIGLAFALFYAICGIPVARWADRGVRRNIIALALATWSVMTVLSGTAQSFWHLFLARVGVGAGEAGCVPAAQSVICDYVPLKRRAGVLAFHNFGLAVGTMVGMAVAGWASEMISWRWAFVVLGAPGVILALIVKLTLREPARGRFDVLGADEPGAVAVDAHRASMRETLAVLWNIRTYRLLMVVIVLMGFVQYGLNQWWPSFYSRAFGLSSSSVGLYLGTAFGIGSGIGLLIGGWSSNKAAQRDVRLPLLFSTTGHLLALPAALGSLLVSSPLGSLILVSLTGLLWSISIGPFLAAIYSVAPARMRATAGATMIFFMSAVGLSLGPFCIGALSDLLAPTFGAEALRYALMAPLSLIPLAVVAAYAAAQTLPDDLRAAGIRLEDSTVTAMQTKLMAAE